MPRSDDAAARLLGVPFDQMDASARKVARHIAARRHIARNLALEGDSPPSRGERAADAVASFGGSWPFVALFASVMLVWVVANGALLSLRGSTFDPYPYILLNLFLSMLAAIQAPVILMSQNRQSKKDRLSAAHDYEVNLKAELEIMLLHDKIDALRHTQWTELMALQTRQLELLAALAAGTRPAPGDAPGDAPVAPPGATA
ncbi:DUF1003 domain-containing protein [Ideonella sp. A 288]|uniref:DUF1003 domain-containing protein n=1 Tax=Ideonella sp. A 288 TaxID=1962181 RepID=UPI000B4B9932|nr:DUF1003 domain-containing protein [Ideonella sp. A 288]